MKDSRSAGIFYICIRCRIPAGLEDELPELLTGCSVLGTEVDDRVGGQVQATVYLSESNRDCALQVCSALADHGALDIEESLLPADDWLAEYRQQVQPFSVGERWWIDPHPDQLSAIPGGRRRLVIEPRMAFGTGTHESTQAILLALEDLEISGRRVLDVGTGSGILALAAERLGAKWVVAVDIDEVAILAAGASARQQDWESNVRFILGSMGCIGEVEFEIVLCNMIAADLLPLAGDLQRAAGSNGIVVCSGLLVSEIPMVTDVLNATGLRLISKRQLGDWVCLTTSRSGVS
jgi:ribosomal protein L11 methyltransferase